MAIEQNISEIPALRHRSTVITPEDQDDFVRKFEANNDHICEKTVSELNTYATQLNKTAENINTSETNAKKSEDSASTDKQEIITLKKEIQQIASTVPEGRIVDSTISETDTWSSQKIDESLDGNVERTFKAAPAVENEDVVQKKQFDDGLKGNAEKTFMVAPGVGDTDAVQKKQLDDKMLQKADKDLTNTPLDWDYACIINGETTGAENEIQDSNLGVDGLVSVNSRYVLNNPFGINTPVITIVEILVNGKWCDPNWVFLSLSHGTNCSFVVGEGIIVRVGNIIITQDTTTGKGNNTFTGNITTPSKCRVHIWKLRRTV